MKGSGGVLKKLCFVVIGLEAISGHPLPNIGNACLIPCKGGIKFLSIVGMASCDVELHAIHIQMKFSVMQANGVTQGQGEDCEQDGAQD